MALLMAVVVCVVSVWPFPRVYIQPSGACQFDDSNRSPTVCLQNTGLSTCGPAAAVTALQEGWDSKPRRENWQFWRTRLLPQEHRPMSWRPRLMKRYGREGLVCDYRLFGDVS